jgi:hypothetical protein
MGTFIFLAFASTVCFMVAIIALFLILKKGRNPGQPGAGKGDSGFWGWFDGTSGGSDSTNHGSSHHGHSGSSHHGGGFDGGGHHGGGFDGGGGFGGGGHH